MVNGDPTPDVTWELNGKPIDLSRMTIHEAVLDDFSKRSELTIRDLATEDAGRGSVIINNIHSQIQGQFSILLSANEAPVQTDFRSQLKNRVQTKALTAEDIKDEEVRQFDFRSNLKKSKTNENLTEISSEPEETAPQIDPELKQKLLERKSVAEVSELASVLDNYDNIVTNEVLSTDPSNITGYTELVEDFEFAQ